MRIFHSSVRTIAAVCLATLAVAWQAPTCQAAFSMKLSDGSSSVQVDDNSALDFDDADGGIYWGGAIGKFDLTVGVGTSTPLTGNSDNPLMHLTGAARSKAPGGELTIMLTQTGFTGTPMGLDAAAFLSSIAGIAGGDISMQTWVGLANGAFEQSVQLSDLSGAGVLGSFEAYDTSALTALNSLFSLTMIVKVTHGAPTGTATRVVSSFDAQLEALPEPGMATVWAGVGSCLLCGAVIRRWRGAGTEEATA